MHGEVECTAAGGGVRRVTSPPRMDPAQPARGVARGVDHRLDRQRRHRLHRLGRRRRRLHPHGARERLHPDAERGDDAVRRLQRLHRRHVAVRSGVRGRRRERRRLLDRLRGRLLRAARAAREEPVHPHQRQAPRVGGQAGSSATATPPCFFARMLPIIRTFISLPAGVARMPFWRFTVLTVIGCIPWVLALTLIGQAVGANWEEWRDHLHYLDYAVLAAIVIGVIYLIVRRRRTPTAGVDGRPSGRGGAGARAEPRARGGRAGRDPGPDRAAARLELGAPVAGPAARGLGLGRDRPRGAQELRGRAARRHRGGAADRPAAGDRRRAGRLRRAPRRGGRALVHPPGDRRLQARAPDRDRTSAGRGRSPPGSSPGRRRCWPPTRGRRSAAPATPASSTGWRSGSPRPRRWCPGSRATARR